MDVQPLTADLESCRNQILIYSFWHTKVPVKFKIMFLLIFPFYKNLNWIMQQVDFSAQKEQMCAECRYNTKTQVHDSTSGHICIYREQHQNPENYIFCDWKHFWITFVLLTLKTNNWGKWMCCTHLVWYVLCSCKRNKHCGGVVMVSV